MQKVLLEQFEGPLELLLELIEREKLSITEISLSKVTEQYMSYLTQLADQNPEELADFLVIASKLLLIKSKILLPELVVEDEDEHDLAMQLKMYKEYYDASKILQHILTNKTFSFSRTKPAISIEPVFNPPKQLHASLLYGLFKEILEDVQHVVDLPEQKLRRTISLQEKIKSIHELISRQAQISFKKLFSESSTKMEVIVTFLALLELVKQRTIVVTQEKRFDDIVVESINQEQNL